MLAQEPIRKPSSIFCFKPILLSAHKLSLLIYGDNSNKPQAPLASEQRCPAQEVWLRYLWFASPKGDGSSLCGHSHDCLAGIGTRYLCVWFWSVGHGSL